MENITLGQISNILEFLVEFVGLLITVSIAFKKIMKKQLESINTKVDALELASIKTDLANFINDVEMGIFKTHIQRLNAHELYDRYTDLGGNSYIHEHWDKLLKEGKI